MKKTIVWDLWGGGLNSLRSAFKSKHILNYEVYTFDIVEKSSGFKNIVLDLAQDNLIEKLEEKIRKGDILKPNIIVCSPLCQSFSKAMQSVSDLKDKNGKFITGNPHHYWDDQNKKIKTWPKNKNITWNGFCGNSYPKGSKSVPRFISELGERCCQNAIKIICYYKPKCWYIENPRNSYMWKFIRYNLGFKDGVISTCDYSAYNSTFSRKPTSFLNNVNLKLKKANKKMSLNKVNDKTYELILSGACKNRIVDEKRRINSEIKLSKKLGKKVNVIIRYKKSSMERSKIPSELLIDIFNQFETQKPLKSSFKSKKIKLTHYSKKPQKINEMIKTGAI